MADAWTRSITIKFLRLQKVGARARRNGVQMATVIAAAVLVSVALGCLLGRILGDEVGVALGSALGVWTGLTGGAPWPRTFAEPK